MTIIIARHDTTDTQASAEADPGAPLDSAPDQEAGTIAEADQPRYTERPMIPVALLVPHPGNTREDKKADPAMCRSVAAAGVVVPLEITVSPDGDGYYVVVDGLLRLDAAIAAGLEAVPYFFSQDTADEQGLAYLHMLITSRYRKDLTVHEEAATLFSASEAGMTRTQIRKATGLPAAEVRAGITAGKLTGKTRELTEAADYEWTLEDLALLAPYEDDPGAMERIITAIGYGNPLQYVIDHITQEREAADQRARLIGSLRDTGLEVLEQQPPGGLPLSLLLADDAPDADDVPVAGDERGNEEADDDRVMTQEAHASCPGAVAVLRSWQQEPDYWCTEPERHQTRQTQAFHPGGQGPGLVVPPALGGGSTESVPDPDHNPERRLVVEGNRAWVAAGTARHTWLASQLSAKTLPARVTALVARFVTTQLITMPQPLRQALPSIRRLGIYAQLGRPAADAAETASMPRLWLLALAPVAAAYEDQITGEGDQRATWRFDRYAPCPRADAGAWLAFCAELGHQLSPIERAVADGLPYRGDNPTPDELSDPGGAPCAETGGPDTGGDGEPEPGSEQGGDAGPHDDDVAGEEALAA